MKTDYRRWTDAETKTLESLYGTMDTPKLCKRLGVPDSRLRRKAKALGLGYQREYDEYVTMRQVRALLGVGHYAINRFIARGLPIIRREFGKRTNVMVSMPGLVEWLKNHQDLWLANKIERFALGSEPQWLRDKRRREYQGER